MTNPPPDVQFSARLDAVASDIERLLDQLLSTAPATGETARPKRLIEAVRYATLGGGKRLRPFLVIESGALFGVPRERALMAGAPIECVHCYSVLTIAYHGQRRDGALSDRASRLR
jgi:farnesyl diphosphate synthase